MNPLPIKQSTRKHGLLLSLLVVLSFLAYGNTLKGDFVWDDRALFVEHYDQWQWANLKKLLTSQDNLFGDRYTGYYRPFPNLTFLADRYLWERNPAGYHLTNIVFHVLTVLVVYWMAFILFARPGGAFLAALCFAWHPINTECVAWINGRNNIIAACFYVLSFNLYLRSRQREMAGRFYWGLSLLAYTLSLLSKEYALTLPILIAGYEFISDIRQFKDRLWRVLARTAPYVLVIIAYFVVRSMVLPAFGVKSMHWESLWARVLTVPKIFALYLKLLALPTDLTVHYETQLIQSVGDPLFWVVLGIALAYVTALVWLYSFHKRYCVPLLWIAVTLLPVLNLIPLSDDNRFMAERYLYLPCVGFSVIIGQVLATLWQILKRQETRWAGVAALVSGCLLFQWYFFGTLNRNLTWRNEIRLWRATVSGAPEWFQPYFNLGVAYRNAEEYAKAEAYFEKAKKHARGREDRGVVLGNLALVHYLDKEYEKAEAVLVEARALVPEKSAIFNLLGNVYLMTKSYSAALEAYKAALKRDPQCEESLISMGMVLFKMGKIDETIRHFENIKMMVPEDGRIDYYLGSAYDEKGLHDKAAIHYAAYLKRLPNDVHARKTADRLKQIEAAP